MPFAQKIVSARTQSFNDTNYVESTIRLCINVRKKRAKNDPAAKVNKFS